MGGDAEVVDVRVGLHVPAAPAQAEHGGDTERTFGKAGDAVGGEFGGGGCVYRPAKLLEGLQDGVVGQQLAPVGERRGVEFERMGDADAGGGGQREIVVVDVE